MSSAYPARIVVGRELSPRAAGLAPPVIGGRYVVARSLGRGAQARVYLAWDLRLRRWWALKVLAEELASDPEHVARFEHEAVTMAELSHPNLARVVDVDADGDLPYLVMELGRGGTAMAWVRRNGPMPPRMALRVAAQCADGLGHAHERGVVHRDVKPQNVLITEDGRVVVIDFGVARTAAAAGGAGTYGTPAYMAPEQRVDPGRVDPRADVYGLGVSLLSLLTGRSASARTVAPEARERLVDDAPEALRPLLLKACHPDREARHRGMAELGDALRRAEAALGEDPPGPSLADRLIPLPEQTPPIRVESAEGMEPFLGAPPAAEDEPTWVSEARRPALPRAGAAPLEPGPLVEIGLPIPEHEIAWDPGATPPTLDPAAPRSPPRPTGPLPRPTPDLPFAVLAVASLLMVWLARVWLG